MLTYLAIENFALVESLSLDLSKGMTALTGETGAGKSILLDALGLALGDRSDSNTVRPGTDTASITLYFDITQYPNIQKWLLQQELDSEDECILRRVISAEGRSRAFINGNPVPLQRLKALGKLLIQLHGQHAHHSLLDPATHTSLFDSYAGTEDKLEDVKQCYKHIAHTERTLKLLKEQAADRHNKLDYLGFQIEQLETAELKAGEWQALSDEQKLLCQHEAIQQRCEQLRQVLEDSEGCLTNQIQQAIRLISGAKDLPKPMHEILSMLTQAEIHIEEANFELHNLIEREGANPERLTFVEHRLSLLHELSRKHRIEPEALTDLLESLREEQHQLLQSENTMQQLETEYQAQLEAYTAAAKQLTKKRQQAIKGFNQTITAHMKVLGLPHALFSANLCPYSDDQPHASGMESIEFTVTTNPGQPANLLHKIASGGELSRISLAIEMANIQTLHRPLLVFDEVDTGIGGAIAEKIGHYLQTIGRKAQVLCVTHLAQVASHANAHLHVSKEVVAGKTYTRVHQLDRKAQTEEIARMLGGMTVTQKTRQHANEMLANNQAGKKAALLSE